MKTFYYLSSLSKASGHWEKVYEDICCEYFSNNILKFKNKTIKLKSINPKDENFNILSLRYIFYLNKRSLKDLIRLSFTQLFKRRKIMQLGVLSLPFYYLLKNILVIFYILKSLIYYCQTIKSFKEKKAIFAVVEHIGFINGSFALAAKDLKIPLFTNNYPYGIRLFKIPSFNSTASLFKFEYAKPTDQYKLSGDFDTNKIPYLQPFKSKNNFDNYDLQSYEYIFYIHLFIDDQNLLGWDGAFGNNLEWALFTLSALRHKKVLVKPHPNFYADTQSNRLFDGAIYKMLKNKFIGKYSNIDFLDSQIENINLLKRLNKKCIAITHHGTVIAECGSMNITTISSSLHPIYDLKKGGINTWKNLYQYKNLLDKKWDYLKRPNVDYCKNIYTKFINTPGSYTHKNNWINFLVRELGVDRKIYEGYSSKLNKILSDLKKDDSYKKLVKRISKKSVYSDF